MNPISKAVIAFTSIVLSSLTLPTFAIGYNGRIDMLQTVNHKEEIESLLNKRYTGDAAPREGGEIHHVKEVSDKDEDYNLKNVGGTMSHKSLLMAAKNGKSFPIFWIVVLLFLQSSISSMIISRLLCYRLHDEFRITECCN